MNTFYLEILSPERTFYEGQCISLTVPISDGYIGIMANHSPLTAAILDGEINFTTDTGEKITCAVTSGMVDVSQGKTVLLCESALYPYEIDEDAERKALNEARLEMKKKQSAKDYAMWQLSFNKAVNRLKVKDKKSKLNLK